MEFYNQFLEYLANFFAAIKEKGYNLKPTDITTNKDYFNLHYKMAVYASPNVINAYSEIIREGKYHSKDPMWAMSKLPYIFAHRKKVGFSSRCCSPRRSSSLWITDISDPKYDELGLKSLKNILRPLPPIYLRGFRITMQVFPTHPRHSQLLRISAPPWRSGPARCQLLNVEQPHFGSLLLNNCEFID